MRAVSPTFHQRQCDRCYTSAPKRYSRKQQFFFLSFSSPPKYKLQRTRLRTLRLGSQQVYLFISMNTNTDTREKWNTHLYWRLVKWQCSVISRTWLYNWSLIDMKSSGLAQVVFYTCCRPRAGNAGGPLNLGAIFWLMSLWQMPFNNQYPQSLCVYQGSCLSVYNIFYHSSVISSFVPKRLTISFFSIATLIWPVFL